MALISGFPEGYQLESGVADIEQLKVFYLFGIDLSDPEGHQFPDELIQHYLDSAITTAENNLDIKITPGNVEETHDYFAGDYQNWGYLQLWKTPVIEVTELYMTYGLNRAFTIPADWIKLSKISGQINLFPASGSAGGLIINSSGIFLGINRWWDYAPHTWKVKYRAGMDTIPSDLLHYIYMQSAISIMTVWGDLIIGAGIASQSIGLDGLSQSIGTTQSAMYGGASGRIETYRKDIELLLPVLIKKYRPISMVVV